MSEMIERVARALFDTSQQNLVASRTNELLYGKSDVTWEFINSEHVIPSIAEDYRTKARAAIEAMREPTQSMIDSSPEEGIGWNEHSRGYAANYYRSMIDAALGKVDDGVPVDGVLELTRDGVTERRRVENGFIKN